jgi:2-oxo-3-hexenedioate decarboxylase
MKHIIELSSKLDAAAQNARPVRQLSNTQALSLAEAYTIQKESVELRYARGEELTGLKLGFTSKAKMMQMGVHDLIWGRLTDKMKIDNGGELHLKNFIHPRAEPEIAFLLKEDIQGIVSREEVLSCIAGIAAAIEIIDSRYEDFKFSLEDVIADNCSSSAYILGDWKDKNIDVSDLNIALHLNGELVETGNSSAILGDPLQSLVEAIRLAVQYKVVLKKDMIVLAGAATPAIFLNPKDSIEVQVEKLGKVHLSVI